MRCNGAVISVRCDEKKEAPLSNKEYSAHFEEKEYEGCRIGTVCIDIKRCETWDTTGFYVDSPIRLDLQVDEVPGSLTCMYLYSEWWTRPSFVSSFTSVPDRTQVIYCKFDDHFSCVLPLVGKQFKATAKASENPKELRMVLDSGVSGQRYLYEDIYIIADGKSLKEAVDKAFKALSKHSKIRLRNERKIPDTFKYIGWCSWDAFYKEINEGKIREKVEEFTDKRVPVKWIIFDDGWMKNDRDMLDGFEPDTDKFPRAFSPLISDIKKSGSIRWVGVWHALGGYWAGVDPESALAKKESKYLYMTRNGRLVPSPENGAGFYEDWYRYLKEEQIDFVKVDGQSAVRTYFRNDLSISEGAKGLSIALEKGAEVFEKKVINCMGMAMENIVSRPETAISRNSDDFVPDRDGGFAEHLLQNAFNAIYHNEVYNCDWDMFWTTHPDAEKHALLRAISGGPVYFSDRIGETNPDIVSKLCLLDGRLLMLDRSACVSEDCTFSDPFSDCAIKIQNAGTCFDGRKLGVVAAF